MGILQEVRLQHTLHMSSGVFSIQYPFGVMFLCLVFFKCI